MAEKFIHTIFQERYKIQSLLGRQTGRRTFLARDLQTQSQVVVKLLLFNPDFTWDDLKLFEREAETLRNLDHPAIPQYLDHFEVETELGKGSALVQSYIEAKSLQDWAELGRTFSEAELKDISTQLLEVLQYLHTRQPPVIHRDIKPSNILLADRSGNSVGSIYLVDFGSVQTVIQSGTITIVGTYGYMPPEQFGGRTTPASDLYSLGATLIYFITGKHPADLPTRRGQIQFEANSHISPRFQAWIKSLIHPELEQRFNTAQKALKTLQNDALALDGFSVNNAKPLGSRRSNQGCTISKSDNVMVIAAPAKADSGSCSCTLILVFSLFIFSPILLAMLGASWLTAFSIMAVLMLIYVVAALNGQPKKILLEINKKMNIAAIYQNSQPKKYLNRVSLEHIIDVQVTSRLFAYSVELRNRHHEQLFVGNRRFWLSEQEAYWIADELSHWLKVPIIEKKGDVRVSRLSRIK